jgi:DNA-binding response OmpR family regulator
VVEDDMTMRRLNAEVLMSAGYEVDAVGDAAAEGFRGGAVK